MNKNAVGIDIGGTNVKIGLVSREGEVIEFSEFPTPKSPPDVAVSLIADETRTVLKIAESDFGSIAGIGIGFPGAIRQPEGIVEAAPNLKGWGGIFLRKLFREAFDRDILIDNDANIAALAEYVWGAGKGQSPLVLFTLGTGVGGGIVIDGKIYRGAWGGAAEIGHQTIDMDGRLCNCGNRGCLEAIVGSRGVASRAWELLDNDKGSILWEMMGSNFDTLDARLVGSAAKEGDPTALKVASETARAIGVAVANMINILNPRCVLFAGGMTEWGEEILLKPLINEAKRRAFKAHFNSCRITFAQSGLKAGILGGAALAFSESGDMSLSDENTHR